MKTEYNESAFSLETKCKLIMRFRDILMHMSPLMHFSTNALTILKPDSLDCIGVVYPGEIMYYVTARLALGTDYHRKFCILLVNVK